MKLNIDQWGEMPIGELCLKVSNIPKSSMTGDFTYIEIGGINSRSNKIESYERVSWNAASPNAKQIIYKEDVLCSTVRVNLKKIAIVDKELTDGIATVGFCVIRADTNKADPRFLFQVCLSEKFTSELLLLASGTTYPIVKNKDVLSVKIPAPPLEEQKQIAKLFQSIDTASELVETQENHLLNLKNQLLKDVFSEKKEFGSLLKQEDFETVRFDKIAINISERVEPKKTTLTTYVGLDHLDADNLTIERTGIPEDVIGTKLKIYKGDIIFGKRRAYLRKVAVSHFDGIASAHSMILRANEQYIEKDFLPYFMQSDVFMDRAVQISEGSLSPTIKNKTLAAQEFVMPKKDKQKELVVLFDQFEDARKKLKQQKTTLINLKQKLLSEILG